MKKELQELKERPDTAIHQEKAKSNIEKSTKLENSRS